MPCLAQGHMCLSDSTSAQMELDEVSMKGQRRNDTNRLGSSAGSSVRGSVTRHPSDCPAQNLPADSGHLPLQLPPPAPLWAKGMIRGMPDHPHEGEAHRARPQPNHVPNLTSAGRLARESIPTPQTDVLAPCPRSFLFPPCCPEQRLVARTPP